MTKTTISRGAALAAVLMLTLSGCGGHKAADVTKTTVTTTPAPTTTSTVDVSNASAVASNVDSSLNDLNSDLSAIDSAPTSESDPTS